MSPNKSSVPAFQLTMGLCFCNQGKPSMTSNCPRDATSRVNQSRKDGGAEIMISQDEVMGPPRLRVPSAFRTGIGFSNRDVER